MHEPDVGPEDAKTVGALRTMVIHRETPIQGPCAMCLTKATMFDGVMVSWYGQPRGAVVVCLDCLPRADRLLVEIERLLGAPSMN